MITLCGLRNFKIWRDLQPVRLAPLTGLFGVNSAGKSSLIQFLLLLKQTAASPDRTQVLNLGDKRSVVDLGTFADIAFQHKTDARIWWEIRWNLPQELKIQDVDKPSQTRMSGKEIGHRAEVTANGSGRPVLDEMHYLFDGHDFAMRRDPRTASRYELSVEPADFELRRARGRPADLPPPIKCYGFPDKLKASYQNVDFLADFELAFENLFDRLYYLGPLREYPQREYTWGGAEPSDMGVRGERAIDAILSARRKGKTISPGYKKRKRTLEEHIAFWLRNLGLISEFRVEELAPNSNLYRAKVRKDNHSEEVLLTDVGFGVSQVLPVLTLCFYVPEGSIIILEHPEIHLHPSVQAGLADVFIDAAKNRKVQIILESHSEHLLRRLQRRIAEGEYSEKEIALYFCGTDAQGAFLQQLQVNLYGEIINWPDDFFGDQFGEIAATQEAAYRRKRSLQK